jgi:4-amino-4-deoxy-L-arabinose transferase-like glycosyltransferase
MEQVQKVYPNKSIYLGVIVIFFIAFFLRFYKLDSYPLQINQDELSNIYDGYCIAETGADRWGDKYPIILKGFGDHDNRPPLYSYLAAGTIKLFGYSIPAGRLPSAIIGFASLILLFIVAVKIDGIAYGLTCLTIAALSPWHLLFSRIAHEGAALPPFFLILSLYLLVLCKESNYKLSKIVLLGFVVGFATNAYQATKFIFFIISIVLAIKVFYKTNKNFNKALTFIFSVALGALPQIIAALKYPDRFFSRANDQLIDVPFGMPLIKLITSNFLSNFDPKYLFLSFGEFNNLSIGRLIFIEIAFFYIGLVLFYFIFKRNKIIDVKVIYIYLFVALLPAAITKDNPHALRTSVSILLFPLFTGSSVYYLFKKIASIEYGYLLNILLVIILAVNSAFYIKTYTKSMPLRGKGQQYGQVAMYGKLKEYDSKFKNVYIQHYGAFQYLFVASYCGISPKEYQSSNKIYTTGPWYQFSTMGKYHFLSSSEIKAINKEPKNGNNLLVLLEKSDNYVLLDSLNFMDEKMYYYKN